MTGRRLLLVNAHGADEFAGGAEGYVAGLADGFAARGYDVQILAAYPSDARGRPVKTLYSKHWRESRARWLLNHAGAFAALPTRTLRAAVAHAAPDLMHTNNLPGMWTGIWEAARCERVPVVHTIHDYQLLCARVTLLRSDGTPCRPHPLACGLRQKRLARWAGAVSDVIGVSHHVLDRHRDFFPEARRTKIGVPPVPAAHTRRPPGERLATLGYLGALEHTKGIRPLLDAAAALAEVGCTLVIGGDGRLRADVEAAAGAASNVVYAGPVAGADKDAFLEQCDAGILPSVWEEPGGPTLVALEWLAASRPLLLSPRGGLREALGEVSGAIAVEPTSAAIADAVARLADAAEWRRAVTAVRPPETRTLDSWLDEHQRVYEEAVAGAG